MHKGDWNVNNNEFEVENPPWEKDVGTVDSPDEPDLGRLPWAEELETGSLTFEDVKKKSRVEPRHPQKRPQRKTKLKKTEFNPWREFDKASKKNVSRRQILRGIFRFLPDRNNE